MFTVSHVPFSGYLHTKRPYQAPTAPNSLVGPLGNGPLSSIVNSLVIYFFVCVF